MARVPAHGAAVARGSRTSRSSGTPRSSAWNAGGARAPAAARRAATHRACAAFRAVVETYIDVLADVRSVLYPATGALGRLDVVRDASRRARDRAGRCARRVRRGGDALLAFVQALAPDTGWARPLPPRGIRAIASTTPGRELRA
jgi:hypothetical protein